MENENETFEAIASEIKGTLDAIEKNCDGRRSQWRDAFSRIEAAHRREVSELRKCLSQAYGDKTGTYTMVGNEVAMWRKALVCDERS